MHLLQTGSIWRENDIYGTADVKISVLYVVDQLMLGSCEKRFHESSLSPRERHEMYEIYHK